MGGEAAAAMLEFDIPPPTPSGPAGPGQGPLLLAESAARRRLAAAGRRPPPAAVSVLATLGALLWLGDALFYPPVARTGLDKQARARATAAGRGAWAAGRFRGRRGEGGSEGARAF